MPMFGKENIANQNNAFGVLTELYVFERENNNSLRDTIAKLKDTIRATEMALARERRISQTLRLSMIETIENASIELNASQNDILDVAESRAWFRRKHTREIVRDALRTMHEKMLGFLTSLDQLVGVEKRERRSSVRIASDISARIASDISARIASDIGVPRTQTRTNPT